MKRLRRIMIFVLIMITGMVSVAGTVYGASVKENDTGISVVQDLGAGSDGKTWKNPHYKNVPQYLFTIKTGGEQKYGYCFQTGKLFSNGYGYTAKRPANSSAWTNLAESRQNIIRLVMFYGYNNGKTPPVSGANTNDYYAATQVLVWEAADGDIALGPDGKWSKSTNKHYNLIAGRANAVKCYEWIKAEISRHVKGPSFAADTGAAAAVHKMTYDYGIGKWKTVLTDTKGGNYYKQYQQTAGDIQLERSGYEYTFTSDKAGLKTCILMNNKNSGTGQELIVFRPSHTGKQSIVAGAADASYFYTKFSTEKTGTGVIEKDTSDGSSPEGFRFLVENKDNGYSKIHTTDTEGRITLELYPGTYIVTELLTDEQKEMGFLSPAGGRLVIRESETTALTLENERKQIPFQIRKTSDSGVNGGFEFVIYDENGTEVFVGKTSADGTLDGSLYPGRYTVEERLTQAQLMDGYRAAGEQTMRLTPDMSAAKILRFHNLWEPINGGIAIRKTADDDGPVGGYCFDIEGTVTVTGEAYMKKGCITDSTGQFITEKLQPGTYTVTERLTDEQKQRYWQPDPQTVEITEGGKGAIVNFENKARRTVIEVIKTSEDGNVEGVQFSVKGRTKWKDEFEEVIRTTDENGYFKIELQPGTYTITETGEKTGGYKPQPPEEITVTGKEGVKEVRFVNIPNSITMSKTEELDNGMTSDNPVPGAVYEVYRYEEYKDRQVKVDYGRYTTDKNGQFTVRGVVPGTYFFSEVSAPAGYRTNETPAKAVFSENDVNVKVTDTDRRASGRITITVKDNQGEPVDSTEIEVYLDSGCTDSIGTYITDETGRIVIRDLPWGDYYIKETKSPRGYQKNNEIKEVRIGKGGVIEAEYEILKEQKRGRVLITKTDEEGAPLADAVFSLYKTDGTLAAQGLKTDKKGSLLVEDLEWGSYYLQETSAPDGYGCLDRPVRFSVNATTGGVLQEITVTNEAKTSYIVISKRIKAEDLHFEHGIPTFTFILTGTDISGSDREYARQVTFSEEYVKENTDEDGYVVNSAAFGGLTAGKYTCREKDTLRYELTSITGMSSNCTLSDDAGGAVFLLEGEDSGHAMFNNEKTDWADLSDSISVNNIIRAEKKLTALAVEYTGPKMMEGNMVFDSGKYLEVTAYYDDGSECALEPEDYTMISSDGSIFERTAKKAGNYTVNVHYTDGGILRMGSFSFTVSGAAEKMVTFMTDGGTALEPLKVWKYDTLSDYDAVRYTTEKEGFSFKGWYIDEGLTEAFTAADPVMDNLTLYAAWEQKHLSDYTWSELKVMSETGKAEQVLNECFETVRADLSDDGMISAENFKHTKAFDCQGSLMHAMIAGFGQDERAGGAKAGISFLVYEPAEAEPMITAETGRSLGWETSYMRKSVLEKIYENLPGAMKEVICPVVKTDITKEENSVKLCITEDYLWLPSQAEIYGAWGYDSWEPGVISAYYGNEDYGRLRSVAGGGTQYALFKGFIPDGAAGSEAMLAAGSGYWTRSVDPSMDRAFCFVDAAGAASSK